MKYGTENSLCQKTDIDFFEIMNCVMIFFLTPEDVKNINEFFKKNGSFDEKRPIHEEIVVDEIHYNGNYMIKIGE